MSTAVGSTTTSTTLEASNTDDQDADPYTIRKILNMIHNQSITIQNDMDWNMDEN